jgi:Domain of unknown function (DUF397)
MPASSDQYPELIWRKSRASADQGACVEMASIRASVLVRDSRNRSGPVLVVAARSWCELIECIKNGELGCG